MRCLSPIRLKNPLFGKSATAERFLDVPCGKCAACMTRKALDWALRLYYEQRCAVASYFVTLTYAANPVSVDKREVQLFLKRLRKLLPPFTLRYYIVSEYGDRLHRPHYHCLFFLNCVMDKDLFTRFCLESWQQGFVYVGTVTSKSIAYCTSYMNSSAVCPPGCVKPFMLCSKGNSRTELKGMGSAAMSGDFVAYVTNNWKSLRIGYNQLPYLPRYFRLKIFDEATDEQYVAWCESRAREEDWSNSLEFQRKEDYVRKFEKRTKLNF